MMKMSWPSGIFECLETKDAGCNCCVQHFFCGLCVWGSALEKAKIKNAETLITTAVVATAVSVASDNKAVDAISNGVGLAVAIRGRRRLVNKYKIDESIVQSAIIRAFCGPCAQVQEVNAVMVNEDLTYGCAELIDDPRAPPKNQTMKRSRTPKTRRDMRR